MAIRDVVTRGYGNGTYNPGVNDVPTRGFTIGVVAVIVVTTASIRGVQSDPSGAAAFQQNLSGAVAVQSDPSGATVVQL